jgi:hypothetical protein
MASEHLSAETEAYFDMAPEHLSAETEESGVRTADLQTDNRIRNHPGMTPEYATDRYTAAVKEIIRLTYLYHIKQSFMLSRLLACALMGADRAENVQITQHAARLILCFVVQM